MPKLKKKSHRGAAKRFKVLKSGKIKRSHAYRSHLKIKKSSKRVRQLRKAGYVEKSDAHSLKKLLEV